MKRTIAILLCLLILVSLVACGNNNAPTEEAQTGQTESETTNEATTPEKSEAPVETEIPEEYEIPTNKEEEPMESEEPTPSFDSTWASNEFEQQIGGPVFADWEKGNYIEGASWEMEVRNINYDAVKKYAEELQSYGFCFNEKESDDYDGLAYRLEADNANGYHIEWVFEAISLEKVGHALLIISK